MDPDAALAKARGALATYRNTNRELIAVSAAVDLADAFEALDSWLSRGGFLPDQWAVHSSEASNAETDRG